jgi:hypothetical protein
MTGTKSQFISHNLEETEQTRDGFEAPLFGIMTNHEFKWYCHK